MTVSLRCRLLVAASVAFAPVGLGCTERSASSPPEGEDSVATGTTATEAGRPALDGASVKPERLDLKGIEARGSLRILIRGDGMQFLPRASDATAGPLGDLPAAEAFARWLGLRPEVVLVRRYDGLIPALLEGRGDVIATGMTVTEARSEKVDFARSTVSVREYLVGPADVPEKDRPQSVEDLAGRTVWVRKSSAYYQTLTELEVEGLTVEAAPEHLDTPRIIEAVAAGTYPLTVADGPIVDAVRAYEQNIEAYFPVSEARELSWAVRPDSLELRVAIDQFRIARALTRDLKPVFRGDLDGIDERGVLRVLTRNNPVTYFLYRGHPYGFEYELARMLADELGVRLEMVVPPDRESLERWLLEGKGDLIAASMTITPSREQRMAFSTPYLMVDEVVVRKEGADGPTEVEDLAGRAVHVRRSSSFWETLSGLKKKRGIDVKLVPVAEEVETEELIGRVARGEIPLTVADSHILDVERTYGVDAEAALALPPGTAAVPDRDGERRKAIAFALRPTSGKLRAAVNDFVRRHYRGRKYNIYRRRYFENARKIRSFKKTRVDKTGRISPFDDIIRKVASEHELDWRLMAAQAYVESGFDPKAQSWVGAKGLFQVMPATGRSLGYTRLEDPEVGTRAGIEYLARLITRFDPLLPFGERVWMALAAYNAGLGHVYDARRLAARLGLDPDRWFGNVEKAMLALSQPKYARQARHGYCRGKEPVAYVSHIREVYESYREATNP